MSYTHVIRGISHWHEDEIHRQLSPLLGYDTRTIGTTKLHGPRIDPNFTLDMTMRFRSRDDYLLARDLIEQIRVSGPY